MDYCSGTHCGLGWGRDISLGGMYVESSQSLSPGVTVSIKVRFRRAPYVSIPARVCRSNDRGFAVHFDRLAPPEREAIQKVVGNI